MLYNGNERGKSKVMRISRQPTILNTDCNRPKELENVKYSSVLVAW